MSNPFKLIMVSAFHEQYGNGLLRQLDGHPSLFCYPFESQISTPQSTSIIDETFVPHRYRYPEFLSDISPEQAYQAIWDQELKTYLRTPHLSKFKDCGIIMDEKERIEAFWSRAGEVARLDPPVGHRYFGYFRHHYIEAFFRSTFDAWKNRASSGAETHYVGYSPPILFGADKFFADFPEGQMVHIIRNPWSGYSDTIKRPFPFILTKYCQVWNMTQLTALTYAQKYKGRFHIVRYEDLIANKQQVMDGLVTSLGLPLSDKVYYPSFDSKPLEQVYPWGTIKTPTSEANLATAHELIDDIKGKVLIESHVLIGMLGYNDFLATGRVS